MEINLIIVFLSAGFLLASVYLFRMMRILSIPGKIKKAKELLNLNDDKAVSILNTVISLDKTNTEANWLISKYNLDKKHFILSLMTLQDMLKYGSFSAEITEQDVREMLARIYLLLGNVEKAMEQFNTMSRKWAMPSSLLKTAIKMQLETGYFAEAKKLCSEGIDLYPVDGEFPFILGTILFRAKDYPSAESRFMEAERKNYYADEINTYLAKIYYILNQFERALDRVDNIREYTDLPSEIFLLKSKIHISLGNYLQAISIMEEAEKSICEDDLFYSEFQYFFAEALESSGNTDLAVKKWENVKETSPHFQDSRDKMKFYQDTAKDKTLRKVLSTPQEVFDSINQNFLSYMDYSVKKIIFQDAKTICYSCSSKRDSHMFSEYIVFSIRETTPINESMINSIISRARLQNIDKIVLIAPLFSDEALALAASKNIVIYGFDAFLKNNIAQKVFAKMLPQT